MTPEQARAMVTRRSVRAILPGVKLYHRTSAYRAAVILTEGFPDQDYLERSWRAHPNWVRSLSAPRVELVDRPDVIRRDLPLFEVLLVVTLDDAVDPAHFELVLADKPYVHMIPEVVSADKPYRVWTIPPEWLNEHATVERGEA